MSTLYPSEFVVAQSISGILGATIISILSIHAIYKLQSENVGGKYSRILYILFFFSSWLTCFGFGFARSNIILPMGDTINCTIGFYLSTQGVFFSKIFLFVIFIYRIDLAFHSSALKYPRWMLGITAAIYIIIICTLDVIYIKSCYSLIHLEPFNFYGKSIGNCTTAYANEQGDGSDEAIRLYLLGLMFIFDVLFSIFVCTLFVYKLNKVIKMMQAEHHGAYTDQDLQLPRLVRKQTILVVVACLTSAASLGMGAIFPGYSLLISTDLTTNLICVWLMFSFSGKYWQFCVKKICCCCYCCVYKEEFLVQMQSISQKYSIRRDTTSRDNKHKLTKNNSNNANDKQYNAPKHPPKQKQKHDDIVNFTNAKDIKSIKNTKDNVTVQTINVIIDDKNDNNTDNKNQMELDDDITIIQSETKSTSDANKDIEPVQDPQSNMQKTSSNGYIEQAEYSDQIIENCESTHL